jgi:formyltetrahydrofolate deformylase
LTDSLTSLQEQFGMSLSISQSAVTKKMAVFVSREDHCLKELAWQCDSGEIQGRIALIISNHRQVESWAASVQIPFHFIPVSPSSKPEAEGAAEALLSGIDLVVLARYMQILSPAFVEAWTGRMINIHHSFLPAFIGPSPYQQAFNRGVKLIGATAHYVTADLDQGPIIEQDVQRVDHRQRVPDLKRLGRHVERMVLARAVRWHLEDRVLIHQNRTVVFP